MKVSATMAKLLEEVRACPGEVFDDFSGSLIGLAWANGWIRSQTDQRPKGALKHAAWWITPAGEAALASHMAAAAAPSREVA